MSYEVLQQPEAALAATPATGRGQVAVQAAPSTNTPLVLLHSSLSSKEQWSRLAQWLGDERQVIAIDLYGYGERGMPGPGAAFSLADEVDAVMEEINEKIGRQPFHLVGHSYGGAIALRLAAERSHRIASLSLYEPVAFFLLDKDDAERREVERLTRQIDCCIHEAPAEAARLFIDYWNGPGAFVRLPQQLKNEFVERIGKVQLDFQALFADRLRLHDLSAFEFPVCLMSGQRSPASTRRIAEVLNNALPKVDRHVFDAGHMAPVTHASQINPVIASFVTRR